MGDHADDAEAQWAVYQAELEVNEALTARAIKAKVWITKDGTEIKVKNMETSHIQNCISKIERDNWRTGYLPILNKELEKRTKHGK